MEKNNDTKNDAVENKEINNLDNIVVDTSSANNMKVIGIFVAITVALGLLSFWLYNPSQDDIEQQSANNTEDVTVVVRDFGEITPFVKKDISDKEAEELTQVLQDLENEQSRLEQILQDAYDDKDPSALEKAFIKVENIRNQYKDKILPFLSETEVKNFEIYFKAQGTNLEDEYVSK